MGLVKPAWPVLQRGHPLTRGLVGAWSFYEGGGSTLNDLAGHNVGTLTNGPAWVGGDFGSSLSFNGTTQYVDCGNSSSLDMGGQNFTIAALINPTSTVGGSSRQIVARDNNTGGRGYGFYINPSAGNLGFSVFKTGDVETAALSSAVLSANTTYFVAGSYRFTTDGASVVNLYINGKLNAQATNAVGPAQSTSNSTYIGKRQYSGFNDPFPGKIGAVLIWRRELSASEISQLYFDPFAIYRKPSRWWEVLVAGGATSYSFPTKSWVWNHQAPVQAFASVSSQKPWQWLPKPPTQSLSIPASQKHLQWQPNAPVQAQTITSPAKAWQWQPNAPTLVAVITAARKIWNWSTAQPLITGGNMSGLVSTVIRYIGAFRRRRSRPPM